MDGLFTVDYNGRWNDKSCMILAPYITFQMISLIVDTYTRRLIDLLNNLKYVYQRNEGT